MLRHLAACALAYGLGALLAASESPSAVEAVQSPPTRREPSSMRIIAPAASTQSEAVVEGYSWRDLLDALRTVETGGQPNGGLGAVGDGGAALGPLQIHEVYHADAAERDGALGDYAACGRSLAYSESVVLAYMTRYSHEAAERLTSGTASLADCERLARQHNGGPRGHQKQATASYWSSVAAALPRD